MDVDELIIELMKIEKDLIWEKIVVGNQDVPIAKLIKHLGNADWVNKGRSYIGENGVCPFCQQKTITIELEQQLNTFFSGEYEKDIQYIKSLIEKYQNISEILISNLGSIVDNEFMVSIGNLDISKYNTLLETLKLLFISVLEKMSLKEKEASKKIVLVNSQEKLNELLNMISDANTNIINHNKIVDNYNDEKKKLIDDVWEFLKQERILRVYNQQLMRLTDLLKHMALQIFKLFHLLQKKIPIKYRDWMEHLPQIH